MTPNEQTVRSDQNIIFKQVICFKKGNDMKTRETHKSLLISTGTTCIEEWDGAHTGESSNISLVSV